MAAATLLLGRSAKCLVRATHLFSNAAKRRYLLVPTAISSLRQFSSGVNNVSNINQQPAVDKDKLVSDILSQLGSMREEIEFLRKAKEESRESPREEKTVVVKEKHPLLKQIELAMSKDETSSRADILPGGFEVECDKPGVAKVTLKKAYKKETIKIEVFSPCYCDDEYELKVIVKVSFSRIFSSIVSEFHCTATNGQLIIDKIKDPSDGPNCEGIIFERLPLGLQTEFYMYLVTRGIDDDTSDMLHEYMVDKMKRENMRGLGKFKKFVEDA